MSSVVKLFWFGKEGKKPPLDLSYKIILFFSLDPAAATAEKTNAARAIFSRQGWPSFSEYIFFLLYFYEAAAAIRISGIARSYVVS